MIAGKGNIHLDSAWDVLEGRLSIKKKEKDFGHSRTAHVIGR